MSNKKTNKKLILFIVGCFIIISLFLINYTFVLAGEQQTSLQIPIPGFQEGKTKVIIGTNTLAEYINAIYQLSIKIISILAVLALMIGGLIWLASAGSEKQVTTAKNIIRNALIALLIVLFSYPLLYFINPSLTRLKDLNELIRPIQKEGIDVGLEFEVYFSIKPKDYAEAKQKCSDFCVENTDLSFFRRSTYFAYRVPKTLNETDSFCVCYGQREGVKNKYIQQTEASFQYILREIPI